MVLTQNFSSAVVENSDQKLVFMTLRTGISAFRDSQKLKERVEITWPYTPNEKGQLSDQDAQLMEEMKEKLVPAVEKDKLGILTGLYTEPDKRTFVFYTRTAKIFGARLNECLKDMPLLPITLYVEIDPQWLEYDEMYEFMHSADPEAISETDQELTSEQTSEQTAERSSDGSPKASAKKKSKVSSKNAPERVSESGFETDSDEDFATAPRPKS